MAGRLDFFPYLRYNRANNRKGDESMDWLHISSPGLGPEVIAFRLFCALVIGVLIGIDRELTRRPAGLRTHMLVALGSCTVMLIGQLIFAEYSPLGATPDPARMAAQVVAGVGFLGAGTIMRGGNSVRGLTTAASLWSVACLSMAVGGGYYAVGLFGTVFMLITLVVFEWLQKVMMKDRYAEFSYVMECNDLAKGLLELHRTAEACGMELRDVNVRKTGAIGGSITFRAERSGRHAGKKAEEFHMKLLELEQVTEVAAV